MTNPRFISFDLASAIPYTDNIEPLQMTELSDFSMRIEVDEEKLKDPRYLPLHARNIQKSITSCMQYIGRVDDFPATANPGDICSYDREEWIFTGNSWQQLGCSADLPRERKVTIKMEEHENCRNCGAPVSKDSPYRCEYCGTLRHQVYHDLSDLGGY